jgi:hypothetical protein
MPCGPRLQPPIPGTEGGLTRFAALHSTFPLPTPRTCLQCSTRVEWKTFYSIPHGLCRLACSTRRARGRFAPGANKIRTPNAAAVTVVLPVTPIQICQSQVSPSRVPISAPLVAYKVYNRLHIRYSHLNLLLLLYCITHPLLTPVPVSHSNDERVESILTINLKRVVVLDYQTGPAYSHSLCPAGKQSLSLPVQCTCAQCVANTPRPPNYPRGRAWPASFPAAVTAAPRRPRSSCSSGVSASPCVHGGEAKSGRDEGE